MLLRGAIVEHYVTTFALFGNRLLRMLLREQ